MHRKCQASVGLGGNNDDVVIFFSNTSLIYRTYGTVSRWWHCSQVDIPASLTIKTRQTTQTMNIILRCTYQSLTDNQAVSNKSVLCDR